MFRCVDFIICFRSLSQPISLNAFVALTQCIRCIIYSSRTPARSGHLRLQGGGAALPPPARPGEATDPIRGVRRGSENVSQGPGCHRVRLPIRLAPARQAGRGRTVRRSEERRQAVRTSRDAAGRDRPEERGQTVVRGRRLESGGRRRTKRGGGRGGEDIQIPDDRRLRLLLGGGRDADPVNVRPPSSVGAEVRHGHR